MSRFTPRYNKKGNDGLLERKTYVSAVEGLKMLCS